MGFFDSTIFKTLGCQPQGLTRDMRTSSASRMHRAEVSWYPPASAHTAPTASPLPTSSSTLTGGRAVGSSLTSRSRPLMMMYKQVAFSPCLPESQLIREINS